MRGQLLVHASQQLGAIQRVEQLVHSVKSEISEIEGIIRYPIVKLRTNVSSADRCNLILMGPAS